MSKATRVALLSAVVVSLLVGGTSIYVVRKLASRAPNVPVALVPAAWERYRTNIEHERHLGRPNIACKDCHDYAANGFVKPAVAVCQRCHEKQAAHFHAGGEAKTDCFSCHSFDPDRKAPKCIDCHASPAAAFPAVIAHRTTECTDCHQLHETPDVAPKACASCHDERADLHANHPNSQNCFDCHRAHAPAVDTRNVCNSCHTQPSGPKPAGHDSCLTCHRPHEFAALGASGCVACHGQKTTLVASFVPAHQKCTNCHTPHAPAAAASSCRSCHEAVHVEHGVKGECTTCHTPHGESDSEKATSCTSCHASVAASDKGAHAGGTPCTSCHKPHGFKPPRDELAVTFDAVPDRHGHGLGARGALCASCHGNEAAHAVQNGGHAECTACHGDSAHKPARAPSCGNCHKTEASTAPAGHRACQQCHEPHGGELVSAAATCTGCHADKEHALHGTIAAGCEGCHRPHGPQGIATPPACTTCHEAQTLPALHAIAKHGTCGNCHASHSAPRSDRDTCTGSCHQDRRDHQPQAAVCTGCHVFRN